MCKELKHDDLAQVAGGKGPKQLVKTSLRCYTPGCGHMETRLDVKPITVRECPECHQMSLIGINVRYITAE